jgi:hypothetical protein
MTTAGSGGVHLSFGDAFDIIKHLRSFEADFDRAQSEIRRAATAIILAAAAAIVYTLFLFEVRDGAGASTTFFSALQSDPIVAQSAIALIPVFVSIIGMVTSLMLALFWMIDQRVYQRLLHSVFVYGILLEEKYNVLGVPTIRQNMYIQNRNVTARLSWFYLLPVLATAVVDVGVALAYMLSGGNLENYDLSLTVLVVLKLGIATFIFFRIRSERRLIATIAQQYPAPERELLEQFEQRAAAQSCVAR